MSDWRRDEARRRGSGGGMPPPPPPGGPTEPPDDEPERQHHLWVQFELFHAANPQFYELFKRFTFYAIRRGHRHLSARMVFHRIRWETTVETVDPGFYSGEFKINNNYSPFYARMFMRDHPAYAGFFRLRMAAADNGKLPEDEDE